MEVFSKSLALLISLVGVGGAVVTFFVARFVVPTVAISKLRTEMAWYVGELQRRDENLRQLHQQRAEDLLRLKTVEGKLERLREDYEGVAAWNYGAIRYMKALEGLLASQGITSPDRANFGINGE